MASSSSSVKKTKNDNVKEQEICNQIIESMDKEDIEEQRKKMQDYVAVNGVSGYKKFLDDRLNEWMKQPLRIAVTGSSGQGKSSLINTLRGLKSTSSGAAQVGVIECTDTVTQYPDPKHPNLMYYDLPGVGTSSYPRDRYFEIIKNETEGGVEIRNFDFFLIISAGRFTENDVWLAQQIQNANKQFYFLRTKVDIDLRNDYEDNSNTHDELVVLQLIRDNCFKELNKININTSYDGKVFLLSTKFNDSEKSDFPRMVISLLHDYPDLKHDAIVMSITVNCKDVIREKAKILRKQAWGVAVASGLVGAIPLPGVSAGAGIVLVSSMLLYYKQCLGLDTESLDTFAKAHSIKREQIQKQLYNTVWARYFIVGHASVFFLAEVGEEVVKKIATEATKVVPVIGSIIGGVSGFGTTAYQLYAMINNLEEAALFVLDYVTSQSKQH